MPVTVTCECGHVTELADREQPGDAAVIAHQVCPICGRTLQPHASAGKRMFQQLWQSHAGESSATAEATAEPSTEPAPARRSLWEVMRGSTDMVREETDAPIADARIANAPATQSSTADAVKPKSLWGVMHATAQPASVADAVPVEPPEFGRTEIIIDDSDPSPAAPQPSSTTVQPEMSAEQKFAQAASLAAMTHLQSSWEPEPEPELFDEDEREWSQRAVMAMCFALTTALVSGLSYRPEWWWRFPALVIGLIAVVLGFMASSDVRISRGRLKGRWTARSSVLIGAFGMFLAPIVFAGMGERARANAGREQIDGRLRRIGQALDQLHNQQGHFPEAALKGRDAHGDNVPMHGWMTPLLPALGYEAIYRQIDLKQPYDFPANVPAMQQAIPEFSLPRRKPSRSPRGLSLTHFAGVGGQDVREPTGLVHLGLFSDGGPTRREHFTDGLSQTIIVGEIRDAFPPWGEPGNVRSIGDGLNRQFRGFGNESGTGATFLHADGSAKFYSNKTDKRVLQRLETRDGAEPE
ncbi:MAG: DUF1559 domain-containing protein [Planctomycetaceae bacterium]|nr:DUF1559 domain-containing protein [Planctomycetaceae bacterium]